MSSFNKNNWQGVTAGNENAGMSAAIALANNVSKIYSPLKDSIAKSEKISLQNALNKQKANTGAIIDEIRSGKIPNKEGFYDSGLISNAKEKYKRDEIALDFKRRAEARAIAAAKRAAETHRASMRGNTLNDQLNTIDEQILNIGKTPTPEPTATNTAVTPVEKVIAKTAPVVNKPAPVMTEDDIVNDIVNQVNLENQSKAFKNSPMYTGNDPVPYVGSNEMKTDIAKSGVVPKTTEDYLTADDDLGRAVRAYDNGMVMPNGKGSAILRNKTPEIASYEEYANNTVDGAGATPEMIDDLTQQILSNPNARSATFGKTPYSFLSNGNIKMANTKNVSPEEVLDAGVEAVVNSGDLVGSAGRNKVNTPLDKILAQRVADAEYGGNIASDMEKIYDNTLKSVKEEYPYTDPRKVVLNKKKEPVTDLEDAKKEVPKKTGVAENKDGLIEKVDLDPADKAEYESSKNKIVSAMDTEKQREVLLTEKFKKIKAAGKNTSPVVKQIMSARKNINTYKSQLEDLDRSKTAKIEVKKQMKEIDDQSKKILSQIAKEKKSLSKIKVTPKNRDQVEVAKEEIARKEYNAKMSILAAKEKAEMSRAKDANQRLIVKENYDAQRKLVEKAFEFETKPTKAEEKRTKIVDENRKKKLEYDTAMKKFYAQQVAKGEGKMVKKNGKLVYQPNKKPKKQNPILISEINDEMIKRYGKNYDYGPGQDSPGRFTGRDQNILDGVLATVNRNSKGTTDVKELVDWMIKEGYMDPEDSLLFENDAPGIDAGAFEIFPTKDRGLKIGEEYIKYLNELGRLN